MTLYAVGHPARERAIDDAFRELHDLQAAAPHPLFTFLGDEIVFGNLPLRDLKAWDWTPRLAQAGIQRLEFAEPVGRDDFEGFLDEVLARLTLSAIDTAEARRQRRSSIRYGSVGVRGEADQPARPIATATISYSLSEEADTVRWFHDAVKAHGVVPLTEAEAVVRSLSIAMHGGRHIVIPLLQLKEFDQYTTTHSEPASSSDRRSSSSCRPWWRTSITSCSTAAATRPRGAAAAATTRASWCTCATSTTRCAPTGPTGRRGRRSRRCATWGTTRDRSSIPSS